MFEGNCSGCLQPKDNAIQPAFLCERVSLPGKR